MARLHPVLLHSKRDLFRTSAKTYQLLINPVILSGEFRSSLLISANETAGTKKNIINFVSVFHGDGHLQPAVCVPRIVITNDTETRKAELLNRILETLSEICR
jgi:hypothetical protein